MTHHKHEADTIYKQAHASVGDFEFNDAVARVFPDMIQRSVPGYAQTVAMSGIIAKRYAQAHTCVYDLGCSLGAVTLAMRNAINSEGCRIIGVDNSQAMVSRAEHYVALDDSDVPVELICADICRLELEPASVVALNFVLQFIELAERDALLARIANALTHGGALILSEKIAFNEHEQTLQDTLHHDFKRANGYSDLEIAQKRSAIEHVLLPETEASHMQRLERAGFSRVIRWHQCFNFVSYLAVK